MHNASCPVCGIGLHEQAPSVTLPLAEDRAEDIRVCGPYCAGLARRQPL